MKILWVNTNFMHPTTKGGQIRTLGMLEQLHRRHEIHFVGIEDPEHPEGPARACEYSSKAYSFPYEFPTKIRAALTGLLSSTPVAVGRFHPPGMRVFLESIMRRERFDCIVVDFLAPTAYFPDLEHALLFQHNVETVIWRRHAEHAAGALRKWYFGLQAQRMFEYERRMCLAAGHVVAVSKTDADEMRRLFGVTRVSEIPTGVDIEYFTPPESRPAEGADLAFLGSMDWLPNVDGVQWFAREVLPLIRRRRPETTLAVVGRKPPERIEQLAEGDPLIKVTGTLPDIRPWLWGSSVAIVPLRIGGGTRLKIYEAMAAKVPVVSTTVGAEGLSVDPPEDILIADRAEEFAERCLELLGDEEERRRMATAAWEMVRANFSWEQVAQCFERIMDYAGVRK